MKEFVFSITSFWNTTTNLTKIFVLSLLIGTFFVGLWIPKKKEPFLETKSEEKKGFELFDSHTWIKGEKEIQILEMRALKGELEKDIAKFEHIKEAHLIIDLPSPKGFNASSSPTKASLILTLHAGKKLTPSCLKAISSHIAGAVRGLEPSRIAISDTKGHLYQDVEGKCFFQEEEALPLLVQEAKDKSPPFLTRRLFFVGVVVLLAFSLPFLFRKKPKKSADLSSMMNRVSLKSLSSMIQHESPSTIASMLSYLEKEKREALLKELPSEIQAEILKFSS